MQQALIRMKDTITSMIFPATSAETTFESPVPIVQSLIVEMGLNK